MAFILERQDRVSPPLFSLMCSYARKSTTDQPVVIRMRTDPYLGECTRVQDAECRVVVTNSNRKHIFASFQSPKPQRGMRRIGLPKMVVLFGEALDILGKVMEEPPKSLAA